jgi:hypothetical protein
MCWMRGQKNTLTIQQILCFQTIFRIYFHVEPGNHEHFLRVRLCSASKMGWDKQKILGETGSP